MKKIPFCKPDISEDDINQVSEVLRSGWITTGPRTAEFESTISEFLSADYTVCLSSATAGMEMVLRLMGIGEGDEVITTPYTYAATLNAIIHVGAKPVLADVAKESFLISPEEIKKVITARTKAIIPVDFAGLPCDYTEIKNTVEEMVSFFKPTTEIQQKINRPIILSDSAHSFGSTYKGKHIPEGSDFSVYSFHAVKNLTTAEGGAIVFNEIEEALNDDFKKKLKLNILHGQTKDAIAKYSSGTWEYDIIAPGYKFNMTDIQAALGIGQLNRYKQQLNKRKTLFERYNYGLKSISPLIIPDSGDDTKNSSYHIYPLRIDGYNESDRNKLIVKLKEAGIMTNVHFKPLPLFTAYSKLFNIKDYPNSYNMYKNEITLPLYPQLSNDDIDYIIDNLKKIFK